jgi:hypothetical protein
LIALTKLTDRYITGLERSMAISGSRVPEAHRFLSEARALRNATVQLTEKVTPGVSPERLHVDLTTVVENWQALADRMENTARRLLIPTGPRLDTTRHVQHDLVQNQTFDILLKILNIEVSPTSTVANEARVHMPRPAWQAPISIR